MRNGVLLIGIVFLMTALPALAANERREYDFSQRTLQQLSRMVSEETGLTILLSQRVRKTTRFEIYNPQPMTTDELYQVFLSIMQLHGYGITRSGNVVRVVRDRKVRQYPNPVHSSSGGTPP